MLSRCAVFSILAASVLFSVSTTVIQGISPRIQNGNLATRTQFPWHVQIIPGNLGVNFSGIMIHPQWVLTCAACVNKAPEHTLYFGHYNLSLSDAEEVGRVVKTVTETQVTLYPSFNPSAFNVDNIALISLGNDSVQTSPYADVIKLDNSSASFVGWLARNPGFGTGPEGSDLVLRYADMEVVDDSNCRGLTEVGQLCASPFTTGSGPCEEEGSALSIVDADGKAKAIAVFSYGFSEGPCPGSSALYTQIAPYVDWINNVTGLEFGIKY